MNYFMIYPKLLFTLGIKYSLDCEFRIIGQNEANRNWTDFVLFHKFFESLFALPVDQLPGIKQGMPRIFWTKTKHNSIQYIRLPRSIRPYNTGKIEKRPYIFFAKWFEVRQENRINFANVCCFNQWRWQLRITDLGEEEILGIERKFWKLLDH